MNTEYVCHYADCTIQDKSSFSILNVTISLLPKEHLPITAPNKTIYMYCKSRRAFLEMVSQNDDSEFEIIDYFMY